VGQFSLKFGPLFELIHRLQRSQHMTAHGSTGLVAVGFNSLKKVCAILDSEKKIVEPACITNALIPFEASHEGIGEKLPGPLLAAEHGLHHSDCHLSVIGVAAWLQICMGWMLNIT
jgi:hypothetical protein